MNKKNKQIDVKGISVSIFQTNKDDYISLTDIAKSKDGDSRAADIIKNWIRNRGTLEFIGTWENLYNPNFKVVDTGEPMPIKILHLSFVLQLAQYLNFS